MMPALPMLRRRADFEAIGRRGTARATPLLVLKWLRTDGAETRIGLSTPRTLGGAVRRNGVRRRLRALIRKEHRLLRFFDSKRKLIAPRRRLEQPRFTKLLSF